MSFVSKQDQIGRMTHQERQRILEAMNDFRKANGMTPIAQKDFDQTIRSLREGKSTELIEQLHDAINKVRQDQGNGGFKNKKPEPDKNSR